MEKDSAIIKTILGIFLAILLIYLLYILSSIFIPLTLAIFIALLMQPILQWLKDRKVPYVAGGFIIFAGATVIIMGIGQVILSTGQAFYQEKDKLGEQIVAKLSGLKALLEKIPGFDPSQTTINQLFENVISLDWILHSTKNIASTVGDITSLFFMIFIFLIATLGGIVNYKIHLEYLTEGSEQKSRKAIENFEEVKDSIIKYIKVKVLVSLATGIGFWLVCISFGVDFAIFWGFLAFILNFIPTVGSIVATVPPVMLGLIQLPGMGSLFFMAICLVIVQAIIGNIIEPKIQGNTLALNMTTVLIGLLFWGFLWGVAGMILSVPLMVLIKVILSQFPNAGVLVRMMGDPPELTGKVKEAKH